MSPALCLLVIDSSWLLHGVSASTSAGESDASASSLLEGGDGQKVELPDLGSTVQVAQAVSLYIMGSLGDKVYNAQDTGKHVLLGELDSLPGYIGESHCVGGLSTAISSSVAGVVGTG